MPHEFTSIAYAVQRLHECEHFLGRLSASRGEAFGFELNAFLSASRSVTFVLQKSMAHVSTFEHWYKERRSEMAADPAMRFFLELRNVSQKQGPVSYVGGSGSGAGGRWSYQFVSGSASVPSELFGRDILDCCAEHLTKLAQLVFTYYTAYPAHACIGRAWTEEGMKSLGFSLNDVADRLGLPLDYLEIVGEDFPMGDRLRLLRSEIDPIDADDLERLAAGRLEVDGGLLELPTGVRDGLITHLARLMEANHGKHMEPRTLFLRAIAERIENSDKTPDL